MQNEPLKIKTLIGLAWICCLLAACGGVSGSKDKDWRTYSSSQADDRAGISIDPNGNAVAASGKVLSTSSRLGNSTDTQVLAGSQSELKFPPGTLAVDQDVSLGESAESLSSMFSPENDVGLEATKDIVTSGQAVEIGTDATVNPTGSFVVAIPLPEESSASLTQLETVSGVEDRLAASTSNNFIFNYDGTRTEDDDDNEDGIKASSTKISTLKDSATKAVEDNKTVNGSDGEDLDSKDAVAAKAKTPRHLVVIYKTVNLETGERFLGIIPTSSLRQNNANSKVEFETRFFGTYQAVYVNRPINKASHRTLGR